MSKFIIVFLSFFFISSTFASDDLNIISREQWGADETLRYKDSKVWQDIYKKDASITATPQTEAQKLASQKAKAKVDKANSFLVSEFPDLMKISETITEQNGHTLVWPIQKSASIKNIVVHHTHNEYKDSLTAVKSIYNTHAIANHRGDIGYNFLIGYSGEIYEGRAGGDYVVGAHAKWNNRATIGISLIGDYDEKPISQAQYNSLEKLISYLVDKYNIDMKQKVPLFKRCISGTCDENPLLIDSYSYPIVGHRDVGHTTCPGDELYAQIQKIRADLTAKQANLKTKNLNKITKIIDCKMLEKALLKPLKKLNEQQTIDLLFALENRLATNLDSKTRTNIENTKRIILLYYKNKYPKQQDISNSNFDTTNKIKIKLSYPESDTIDIVSNNNKASFFLTGSKLFINDKEVWDFQDSRYFKINSKNSFLTISSWDRKYDWDKTGLINDNKFRGDLILYKTKNNKIGVINELYLSDYLKGLGEISDNENSVKAETMIILARSYARYYMTEARKFPGQIYDGSDNPDEFQRYLGYGLELRSPNLNKIVEKTENQVLTYSGKLIKPWYFSSSNGKTKSFLEYCKQNNSTNFCQAEAKKYPYLISKIDLGTTSATFAGHGVGVPGTGVSYLAKANWNTNMILKYYLSGVSVVKM